MPKLCARTKWSLLGGLLFWYFGTGGGPLLDRGGGPGLTSNPRSDTGVAGGQGAVRGGGAGEAAEPVASEFGAAAGGGLQVCGSAHRELEVRHAQLPNPRPCVSAQCILTVARGWKWLDRPIPNYF